MSFHRLFFSFLLIERIIKWVPKILLLILYALVASNVLYLTHFGIESFVNKRLFYHPTTMLKYLIEYIKWVLGSGTGGSPTTRHYAMLLFSSIAPIFIIRLFKNIYYIICASLTTNFQGKSFREITNIVRSRNSAAPSKKTKKRRNSNTVPEKQRRKRSKDERNAMKQAMSKINIRPITNRSSDPLAKSSNNPHNVHRSQIHKKKISGITNSNSDQKP